MKDYILLVAATLLQTGTFAISKLYQKDRGSSFIDGLKFTVIGSIFTGLIFFVLMDEFKLEITSFSLLMAICLTILTTAYTLLGFKIMEGGQLTLYTFFLMTGGMFVPYVWGLLFLGEPFSILRTIGLVLIIISIFITEASGGKTNKKQLFLCCLVFLLNGFVSVVSKEHQINPNAVSSTEFVFLSHALKVVLFTPVLLLTNNRGNDSPKKINSAKLKTKVVMLAGISAVIGGVSYLLQLVGAKNLPASVLYPIFTGGTIIFTALAGWMFFGEKPDKRHIMGIAICFVGTLLFL